MKTLLTAAALVLVSLNFGAHALRTAAPSPRTAAHVSAQAALADNNDGSDNGDDDDDDDEDDEEDRA